MRRKLSDMDALEMRNLHHEEDWDKDKLAKHFDVSPKIVYNILKGRQYKNAGGPIGYNGKRTIVDSATVADWRTWYNSGTSRADLAEFAGVDESTMHYFLFDSKGECDVPQCEKRGADRFRPDTELKISDRDKEIITRRYQAGGITQAELAAEYDVDPSYISLVVRGLR